MSRFLRSKPYHICHVLIQLASPGRLDPAFAQIHEIAGAWDGTEPRREMSALFV